MCLRRKVSVFAAALFLLALCVSASADVVATWTDHLVGEGDIYDITCNAVVNKGVDNVYTYSYELIYNTGLAAVHTYKVQNPNGASFFEAANTPAGEPAEFANPLADDTGWVTWTDGVIDVGQTRTFSYKSMYAPMTDIHGWTIVIDGGTIAVGKTLVMGASIPEPSSLAAILFGAAGMLPLVARRRK